MQIFFFLLIGLLALVAPEMALANSTLMPSNGNAWDMFVFGNGRVVFDVLNSIKMLMVPSAGSSGFKSLLLFMSVTGFVILAVAAGFDPAKNLLRMFFYLLVVWFVTWSSTSLVANVNVIDLTDTAIISVGNTHTVEGVPALVVLPAALTSQVGKYFTQTMETYFSMPGEFKIGGNNAGQFNLFAKMLQESNEFVITDPGLKQSLSAYVTDCVVPALARGKLTTTIKDETGNDVVLTGTNALAHSPNLMDTLSTASHNSIMTKVYPAQAFDLSAALTSTGMASTEIPTTSANMGVVVTCKAAYTILKSMMEQNATNLLSASSKAYESAGIMTPYETLFSTMLTGAAAPGGRGALYSRPSGFMMQQGLVNSMNGAFRQAAVQTGNNEIMTAAAISQAEQNQRSAWVAGFHVFNNMMGYVFTVLQVFIFAITPIVVIALLVPGLGKSIFTNYAQILIWLMLWMPMLALINFIITLFGTESISMTLNPAGGLSLSNKSLMTERTNNLVIAAQFLGTMTPLLTWGLVRGAMAFTEFISSGVGSAFATQAGAVAATGNFSSNNLSMDNASANKFNTAMASTVGTQATNAFTNAGSMLASADLGGGNVLKSGGAVDLKQQASSALSKSIAESQAVSSVMSDSLSKTSNFEQAYAHARSSGQGSASEKAAAQIYQTAKSAAEGNGWGKDLSMEERQNLQRQVTAMEQSGAGFKTGASLTPGIPGVGGVQLGADASQQKSNASQLAAGSGKSAAESEKVSEHKDTGKNNSHANSATEANKTHSSLDDNKSASSRWSSAESRAMQDAISKQDSYTTSLSAAKSVVDTFGVNSDLDVAAVNQRISAMNSLRDDFSASTGAIHEKAEALTSSLTGRSEETAQVFDSYRGKANSGMAAFAPSTGNPPDFEKTVTTTNNNLARIERDAVQNEYRFEGDHTGVRVDAASAIGNVTPAAQSMLEGKYSSSGGGNAPKTPSQLVSNGIRSKP